MGTFKLQRYEGASTVGEPLRLEADSYQDAIKQLDLLGFATTGEETDLRLILWEMTENPVQLRFYHKPGSEELPVDPELE